MAGDRGTWRQAVQWGIKDADKNRNQLTAEKRARKKLTATKTSITTGWYGWYGWQRFLRLPYFWSDLHLLYHGLSQIFTY
jgi:hypothetical protein